MLRSVLLTLALAGACAAQPPTPRDPVYPPKPITKFDPEVERLRLIAMADRAIAFMEDDIQSTEEMLRTIDLNPKQRKTLEEGLVKVRKIVAEIKQRRQKLIDQGAKARGKPIPVAPMPREKRIE